jgi:formylglycine-generating enzyme required for sulfatase activity
MPKIFLSYRREDSAGVSGRIYDRLCSHFGHDAVFMDVDSIPFGEDFRKHIDSAVSQCDLVLVVIGPKWVGEADAHRRIDDRRDFVRIEIESALNREIPVIPILIDRTRMPIEGDLPPSLAELTFRNAIEVDQGRDFHPHVDRLVQGIESHFKRVKARADGPASQPAGAPLPTTVAKELDHPRIVSPTDPGKRSKRTSEVQPLPGRPPSPSAPRRQSNFKTKEGADGLEPKAPPLPSEMIGSKPLPMRTPSSQGHDVRDVSTQLEGRAPTRGRISWLRLCVATVALLAFAAVIIYVVTDNGTVKITGIDEHMKVSVDGQDIQVENLGKPIKLRAGTHRLLVKRDGLSVKTDAFDIRRGQEKVLEVTYTPKAPEVAPKEAHPNAGPAQHASAKPSAPAAPADASPTSSGPEFITTATGKIKLKLIPAGEFIMGYDVGQGEPDERPRHKVRITRPFYLGVHEVTQGQYEIVMGRNPSDFSSNGEGRQKIAGASTEAHPVENVSWLDTVQFCNKLSEKEGLRPFYLIEGESATVPTWTGNGYRLPTEAEWEYASGGGPADLGETAWYDGNSGSRTHPAGQRAPNRFGLYDMFGNVYERCWDAYASDYYRQSPAEDPHGASEGSLRVIRSGSWVSPARNCRSAGRNRLEPGYRHNDLGFRLARGRNDHGGGADPLSSTAAKRPEVIPPTTPRPRPGPEFITTATGRIKLKLIPAGAFMMGSDEGRGSEGERPRHKVRITRPFYLGVHEVTQVQ